MEYLYWELNYISCEGNHRHTVIRTPADWEEWQIRERLVYGGCGDDMAEFVSLELTCEDDIYIGI